MTFDQFCEKVKEVLVNKDYHQIPDEDTLQEHFNEDLHYITSAGIFIDTWEEEKQ